MTGNNNYSEIDLEQEPTEQERTIYWNPDEVIGADYDDWVTSLVKQYRLNYNENMLTGTELNLINFFEEYSGPAQSFNVEECLEFIRETDARQAM